eukprot:44299-Eustigmatos_ZCMA.PRE.1
MRRAVRFIAISAYRALIGVGVHVSVEAGPTEMGMYECHKGVGYRDFGTSFEVRYAHAPPSCTQPSGVQCHEGIVAVTPLG